MWFTIKNEMSTWFTTNVGDLDVIYIFFVEVDKWLNWQLKYNRFVSAWYTLRILKIDRITGVGTNSGITWLLLGLKLGVSWNRGTPKSSIWMGFSLINHPAIGVPPWLWNPPNPFIHYQTFWYKYLVRTQVSVDSSLGNPSPGRCNFFSIHSPRSARWPHNQTGGTVKCLHH